MCQCVIAFLPCHGEKARVSSFMFGNLALSEFFRLSLNYEAIIIK